MARVIGAAAASDHSRPLGRWRPNSTNAPPLATSTAKQMRPRRESGVVFGSEIMRKANSNSAPLCGCNNGIVSGSPSHTARPTTSRPYDARNAYVTSPRSARCTTSPPSPAIRPTPNATLPHWPGETQTCPLTSSMTTRPRFVGLNRCRPSTRHRNLLAIVTTAAITTKPGWSVRGSRQSESPEIRALRGSNRGKAQRREHAYWVARQTPSVSPIRPGDTSKSSHQTPYTSRAKSTPI